VWGEVKLGFRKKGPAFFFKNAGPGVQAK